MQGATENSLVIIDEFGKGTATVLYCNECFKCYLVRDLEDDFF